MVSREVDIVYSKMWSIVAGAEMTDKQDSYFKALGIRRDKTAPEIDGERLREAYKRAHEIRKFEIEMYWRRSSYMWTLQAAALAGLAIVVAQYDVSPLSCSEQPTQAEADCVANRIRLIVLAGVWLFGVFSAYVWFLLLRGAKYWQNNWERHLDTLEDHFSGALYKTYPAAESKAPYSVTKLNELMALFMFTLWLIIGISAMALLTAQIHFMLIAVAVAFVIFFLTWFFDDCLRMTGYPELSNTEPSSDLVQQNRLEVVRRPRPVYQERSHDTDNNEP